MRKTKRLSKYLFKKNRAYIQMLRIDPKAHGVPSCDVFLLEFKPGKGDKFGVYMRPDEAVLLASLITRGVWEGTKSYQVEGLK